MDKASEALLALKPVTFRYKKDIDGARMLSFGLIAEEVAQVNPDLVTRNEEGKPESVRYDARREFVHRPDHDRKGLTARAPRLAGYQRLPGPTSAYQHLPATYRSPTDRLPSAYRAPTERLPSAYRRWRYGVPALADRVSGRGGVLMI